MNEDVPQRVKDILISKKRNANQGATEFLLSLKVGEIKQTSFKGNSFQGIVTSKRSRAYGMKIRTCHVDGKRYVLRVS